MTRFMAGEKESTFFVDVFKIAMGVFIGGLLAALAYTKIISLGVEYAARDAMATLNKEANLQAAESRKAAALQSLQSEQKARQLAEAEKMVVRARQQHEQRQHEKEAQLRLEWQKIYKQSAACQIDSTTMPCVNAYAAARNQFIDRFGEAPPRF